MENKRRLKPIVFTTSAYSRTTQNTAQQMMLLKALKITQDPKKLKEMIGVKTVAQVYQTLDKIANRKEYHKALETLGISFDFIAKGIKDIALTGEKDKDRLSAYQTLLKSVGMDKYDSDSVASTGTWEELLLQKIEEEKKEGSTELQLDKPLLYEVVIPQIPESAMLKQKEEIDITGSIYDSK